MSEPEDDFWWRCGCHEALSLDDCPNVDRIRRALLPEHFSFGLCALPCGHAGPHDTAAPIGPNLAAELAALADTQGPA